MDIQWRGFNKTNSAGCIVKYPLLCNIIYFMNISMVNNSDTSDTGGVDQANCLFPHSPQVSNILSECWLSIYNDKYYGDLIIICS